MDILTRKLPVYSPHMLSQMKSKYLQENGEQGYDSQTDLQASLNYSLSKLRFCRIHITALTESNMT